MPNNVASLWSPTRQTFFGCSSRLFCVPLCSPSLVSYFTLLTKLKETKKKQKTTVSVNRYPFYSIKCNRIEQLDTKLSKNSANCEAKRFHAPPTPAPQLQPTHPHILTSFRKKEFYFFLSLFVIDFII